MTSHSEQMFLEFEDLENAPPVSSTHTSNASANDSSDPIIASMDALSMTQNELLFEMDRRGLHARGFFADDAKVLQIEFDKEHENYSINKKKEYIEKRATAQKQAGLQKRRMVMESQILEEDEAVASVRGMRGVLENVRNSKGTDIEPTIKIDNITSRSLAKALWNNCNIVSLDVSRMKLSDVSGGYLMRCLVNNKSIKKLDAMDNFFGPQTLRTLGESLIVNDVIVHINLESNKLCYKQESLEALATPSLSASQQLAATYASMNTRKPPPDLTGLTSLSKSLASNKTLTYLSLYRCLLPAESGSIILSGLKSNAAVLFLDIGNNYISSSYSRKIVDVLDGNLKRYDHKLKGDTMAVDRLDRVRAMEKGVEDKRIKDEELVFWMEEQKVLRDEGRREENEQRVREIEEAKEAMRLKEVEVKRLAEEQAVKDALKKSKKKGKKK